MNRIHAARGNAAKLEIKVSRWTAVGLVGV